ncbi:uncharacterized protein DS421_12g366990 [Arachis hypogaea]|nr:uncharacterized protein DS421_12g366990 [Arachis hypogaea]
MDYHTSLESSECLLSNALGIISIGFSYLKLCFLKEGRVRLPSLLKLLLDTHPFSQVGNVPNLPWLRHIAGVVDEHAPLLARWQRARCSPSGLPSCFNFACHVALEHVFRT